MKKFVRPLISLAIVIFWSFASLVLAQVISSRNSANNKVPDYYYSNYKFNNDWIAILDRFSEVNAMYSVNQSIPSSKFSEISTHFKNVFPHLTKDYTSVYQRCTLLADSLSRWYSYDNMEAFMWNACYKSLTQAINRINSSYTVQPVVTANPSAGMAPLTVTFDARNSIDPSQETIPANNFYRYYRDEKWVDRPIWYGQVRSYTFTEPGKFIVHLVVRSSNVNQWILDWEKNLTINVTPKAADIVVYANTRMLSNIIPLKLWTAEGERWIVFDWSLTKPRWWRKILRHRWTIINSSAWFSYDSKYIDWEPSYINVPLKWNWTFKVTLTTVDNEGNSVSEDYSVYLSDPVTIIRQSPENWNTSTTFTFDGSASYSITNRLNTYIRELFDGNWDENNGDKIMMVQGKRMDIDTNKKLRPWNYLVRLTVTDMNGNQNVETKDLYIDSTTPNPQFTVTPTSKRQYPSEFILDASNTTDIDVNNGVDSLEYSWEFSTDNVKILSTENNNKKVVVQFNEKWNHQVIMTATDQYWKSASISKNIEVKSILRPEIEIIPGPITRQETLQLKSSVNEPIRDYTWDFWDGTESVSSERAVETRHTYQNKWVYVVNLTVTSENNDDTNTVSAQAFIGEINHPIASYSVKDGQWYEIQPSETCKIKISTWKYVDEIAYLVDRYGNITIDPGASVNTKGTKNWLQYVFEKEAILWVDKAKISDQFTTSFSEVGCHYVDFTVKDSNVWKQDNRRIWFKVKNALPTIKNVTLSFPQYENNDTGSPFWFPGNTNSNTLQISCSWNDNLIVKVTADDAADSDWNVSRLRFYYYNVDDPTRILEYKDSRILEPYVYFVLPRISWDYKFWVMVYDNDGWMIDSEDKLAKNPWIFFPAMCGETDIPTVTLKVSSTNIQVWDTVTYTIVSKIWSNNEDFKSDRTFYYDYDWDWVRDYVTKKDTTTYTFIESYEDGVIPRAAVEYRWKLWQWEWAKILVKNWIKPILLSNSYGNTVIFRDMSVGALQQRQVCFETDECDIWNTKFRKTHIVTVTEDNFDLTWWTKTSIKENDSFLWKYSDYGVHKVSLYLKNKYWIEVQKIYNIETSKNTNNWKIANWVNMITIPEMSFTNANPEVFLTKDMNSTLLMYINNENEDTCYVDVDISTDSDWDWKTDNDTDIQCNKMAKVKYEPDYESAVGRIYFKDKWKSTFKNFYVTFEWIILELDEEKKEIYNDITKLFNGIEDSSVENTNLKVSLDRLRKNLNNRSEVTSLVITINDQIAAWWLTMTSTQKDNLEAILTRLSNKDTVITVWKNEYEKNQKEIFALYPDGKASKIETLFKEFDENLDGYGQQEKAQVLEKIRDEVIKDAKKNDTEESDFTPYFCNIFEYYNIDSYTERCSTISDNHNEAAPSSIQKSEKSKSWFPLRLKIVLIILVWWLLIMWWIIVYFSIKAKMNSSSESDEDEW